MASVFSPLSLYALLLLINLILCPITGANHGVHETEETYHLNFKTQSFFPKEVCDTSQELDPLKLKIVHKYGPCSTHKKKLTHKQIFENDQVRVNWIHQKASTNVTASSKKDKPNKNPLTTSAIPVQRGTSLGTGNYIVSIGFGTPTITQQVIIDTGSDVTWIQCQPCVSACYQQQDQLFDPTQSSTYVNITCTSPYCSALDNSACSGSTCLYTVRYGDKSSTVGFFAQETLTLSTSDVISNFRFGCGEKNNGLFGQAAGLLGLGRNQVSLVMQASEKYGGVFSYCLPSLSSSSGYLTFGSSSASDLQYTPMLSDSRLSSFYFLQLMGIRVGGIKLDISPTLFSNAGVIIDSGTVITRVPPTAYIALRTAFVKLMSEYPTSPAASIFDTCYDLSKYDTVSIPKVALQYQDATMDLGVTGILYVVSTTKACLAFAPNSDDTDLMIIGNTQQKRFNVLYDVSKEMIGFGPQGC